MTFSAWKQFPFNQQRECFTGPGLGWHSTSETKIPSMSTLPAQTVLRPPTQQVSVPCPPHRLITASQLSPTPFGASAGTQRARPCAVLAGLGLQSAAGRSGRDAGCLCLLRGPACCPTRAHAGRPCRSASRGHRLLRARRSRRTEGKSGRGMAPPTLQLSLSLR